MEAIFNEMEQWQILAVFGVICFALEIFTTGFIFGSMGVGCFFATIAAYLGATTQLQILAFSVGIMVSYFAMKPLVKKYGTASKTIKTNQHSLIGRKGIISQEINHNKNTGRVSLDGDDWKAVSQEKKILPKGGQVEVVSVSSIVLTVKDLN